MQKPEPGTYGFLDWLAELTIVRLCLYGIIVIGIMGSIGDPCFALIAVGVLFVFAMMHFDTERFD